MDRSGFRGETWRKRDEKDEFEIREKKRGYRTDPGHAVGGLK